MAEWKKIASTKDVAQGRSRMFQVGPTQVAVFNLGGKFYAIDDECPHSYGQLYGGMIEGNEVNCPWHGSRYDITTGKVTRGPSTESVRSFPTKVEGEDIYVEI